MSSTAGAVPCGTSRPTEKAGLNASSDLYDAGRVLRYGPGHSEDRYVGLGQASLYDSDEDWSTYEISDTGSNESGACEKSDRSAVNDAQVAGGSGGFRPLTPVRVSFLAVPVDDAELARLSHRHVDDLLTWLDDYPADQVDPAAVAAVRRSFAWLDKQHPVEQGDWFASLTAAAGLLVDLMWWLDTCEDEQVDSFVAVKLQEATGAWLDELTDDQRRRLVEALGELAASEEHDGRRYEIRFFAFALGLVDDEIDEEAPAVRDWVPPEDRARESPRSEPLPD